MAEPCFIPARNDSTIVFLVDEEDYPELSRHQWYSMDGYAYGSAGVVRKISMHRYLLGKLFDLRGLHIDHCNRCRWDNRRANLRVCTPGQNSLNKGLVSTNTSGHKGVTKQRDVWTATIGFGGRSIHLGGYPTREEAAVAYDIKARELYGEFASLNIACPNKDVVDRVQKYMVSAKRNRGACSRYKGVSLTQSLQWRAYVTKDRKQIHLGCFENEEDAARAVDRAVIDIGLSYRLNFPTPTTSS
jgi:hypothetical protein